MNELLMTKREVAAMLRVSTKSIDRWCAARLLPFSLAGSRRRFSLDDVAAYLNRHRSDLSRPARTI